MPKQCASLTCDGKVIYIALPCRNWTLCNVCWTIRPTCSKLPDTMPAKLSEQTNEKGSILCLIFAGIFMNCDLDWIKTGIWGSPVYGNVVFDMVDDFDKHCIVFPSV